MSWLMNNLPESFRAGVEKGAAAVADKAKALRNETTETFKTKAAGVIDSAFNKFDDFQKERLPDDIKFKYETPTLTADNFKDEVRKLKDNLVIALNETYGNNYPTIDCLLRFSPSVKVYRRDPSRDVSRMLFGSRTWTEMDVYEYFYKQFNLSTFDDFQTKVKDFEYFKTRMSGRRLMKELQLKIELSNKFDAEQNNQYSTCNRERSGGHRRRSSRKNYRKSVRTAKRGRSTKRASAAKSSRTRRQRK